MSFQMLFPPPLNPLPPGEGKFYFFYEVVEYGLLRKETDADERCCDRQRGEDRRRQFRRFAQGNPNRRSGRAGHQGGDTQGRSPAGRERRRPRLPSGRFPGHGQDGDPEKVLRLSRYGHARLFRRMHHGKRSPGGAGTEPGPPGRHLCGSARGDQRNHHQQGLRLGDEGDFSRRPVHPGGGRGGRRGGGGWRTCRTPPSPSRTPAGGTG